MWEEVLYRHEGRRPRDLNSPDPLGGRWGNNDTDPRIAPLSSVFGRWKRVVPGYRVYNCQRCQQQVRICILCSSRSPAVAATSAPPPRACCGCSIATVRALSTRRLPPHSRERAASRRRASEPQAQMMPTRSSRSPRLAGSITATNGALPSFLARSIARRAISAGRWLGCSLLPLLHSKIVTTVHPVTPRWRSRATRRCCSGLPIDPPGRAVGLSGKTTDQNPGPLHLARTK
jgi:hypothetical protein